MPGQLSKAAAIVGAAEAKEIGYPAAPKTSLQLSIEAIKAVSDQTGIPISRINGVFSAGQSSELAEHLGIHPRYIDTTSVGGCSFEMHVHHALAAIYAGIIDVALVVLGQAGWSARGGGGGGGRGGPPGGDNPGAQMTMAYGLSGAPSNYSHAMTRHNYRYGTTPEDFAHIAVVTREWATLNPRAVMHSRETHPQGGPITVEDVQSSRIIAWPLTLLHCCLVTDYGGAIIMTSPEIARSLKTKPVWVAGAGESMGHSNMLEMEDFTATSAAASGAAAYTMAGMGPDDMEMAMVYDSFTVTAGITMEMLGLAPRGEGFLLWKEGHARPGGRLPINTNGGGLSFNHSGMYGMQLLVEAYRQLSGTAEDGINGIKGKQTKARSCVVNGTGGSLSTTGTLVLTAD
jgi:acetyl-CoA acetyltransferase